MAERERGLILNLGSVEAFEGMTDTGVYADDQARASRLESKLLSETARLRVKVVQLNPGFVDTEMTAHFGSDRERALRPEDSAEAAMSTVRTSTACCSEEITLTFDKTRVRLTSAPERKS